MRKVYIRGDGNGTIGMGHLMRLLTVAGQMRGHAELLFLCAQPQAGDFVEGKGFHAFVLQSNPSDMETELPALLDFLDREALLWKEKPLFLIDSYAVTEKYLNALGKYGETVLFDDEMRKVFPVDGIINYNCFADDSWYAGHYPGKRRMIGPAYAPLRPEFSEGSKANTCASRHVLITTGGGDREHIGAKILREICETDCIFHLILGNFSTGEEALEKQLKERENVIIHQNVSDMAGLMRKCMLGITAGGSTVYEMCAMGLPMIVFSYAENQEQLAEYIGREGAGFFAGAYHLNQADCMRRLQEGFLKAAEDENLRIAWKTRAGAIVDGLGAKRLAGELLNDCIS